MKYIPPSSEVILAIFTSLLSLATSLLLIKIQRDSSKAINEIEKEKKIIKVKQSDIRNFVSSKLESERESKEALEFLENDLPSTLSELESKLSSLNSQIPTATFFVYSGVIIAFIALGATAYLWYTTIKNGGKIYSSSLIVVGIITIFAMIYFGFVSWIVRRIKIKHSVLMNKLNQISGEILRAMNSVLRSKN